MQSREPHLAQAVLNATNIFQGILTDRFVLCRPFPDTLPNQQRFDPSNADLFINQNYLNPATGFPVAFQPFGYPQGKGFVYAYSQQANLTFEQDLGHSMSFSLGYNFNAGRHLNRPINANTTRGDLLVKNWQVALNDPNLQRRGRTAFCRRRPGCLAVPSAACRGSRAALTELLSARRPESGHRERLDRYARAGMHQRCAGSDATGRT